MDMAMIPNQNISMRRRGKPYTQEEGKPRLRLGKWLIALGMKQVELADGSELGEAYISQLISGKKVNPSEEVKSSIETFLGFPFHFLYEDPPSQEVVRQASSLPPEVLARLRRH